MEIIDQFQRTLPDKVVEPIDDYRVTRTELAALGNTSRRFISWAVGEGWLAFSDGRADPVELLGRCRAMGIDDPEIIQILERAIEAQSRTVL